MLKLAVLAMAAASAATAVSATQTAALTSANPWWEKITVTMTGDGQPQSCRYESSRRGSDSCDVETGETRAHAKTAAGGEKFTRITFERRFEPGGETPDVSGIHPGDTLLGGQIMALAIDGSGTVRGCKVVAVSGEMKPDYGCEEAAAERFDARSGRVAETPREGFMTILVYGHAENLA